MNIRETSGVKTTREADVTIVDATANEPITLGITRKDRMAAIIFLEADEALFLADKLKAAAERAADIS